MKDRILRDNIYYLKNHVYHNQLIKKFIVCILNFNKIKRGFHKWD